MRKELDKALCAKYPLIFRDRNAPMTQTAMCWGICTGDGWYTIIDVLCGMLYSDYRQAKDRYDYLNEQGVGGILYGTKTVTQEAIDEAKAKMDEEAEKVPVASQIKEKFGGLRFYVDRATDKHWNFISVAESMSYHTCEECGAPGKRYTDGYHQTLCDIHAEMNSRSNQVDEEDEE
jgi:hypothetical protein